MKIKLRATHLLPHLVTEIVIWINCPMIFYMNTHKSTTKNISVSSLL